ncbi:MAG: RidA family protein [Bacteroidales bacterium]|nr:RidA family protein [Bacteroidales bacterium]
MEVIKTNKAPAAFGPFCQAVKLKGFIFTSGILPLDPLTGKKVEGGIEEETKQTLENIKQILKASNSSLQNVVRVTIFLVDMNDFEKVNSIYSQYFSEPYPARAAIGVNALAKDARIEIQAIAVCPE